MKIFKFATKEVLNHFRFSLFFVFNLSLGLSGFISLEFIKESVSQILDEKSKTILAADLSVSARRPITPEEFLSAQGVVPTGSKIMSTTSLYSMVSQGERSRLAQLRVIPNDFPYYGEMGLGSGLTIKGGEKRDISEGDKIWVYPELLPQLGVQLGDKIQIGDSEFIVSDTVTQDSQSSSSAFSLAPRIYMSPNAIEKTNLLSETSLAWHRVLIKLPQNENADDYLNELERLIPDQAVRITTHKTAGENFGRTMGYLNDYLSLVALVALFLTGIGTLFLFRSYFISRLKSISLLMVLGASKKQASTIYLFQILLLGTVSVLISLFFAFGLVPQFSSLFSEVFPIPIQLELDLSTILLAFIIGLMGCLVICAPLLTQIKELDLSRLIQGGDSFFAPQNFSRQLLQYTPALLFFWGLAIWQGRSFTVGSLFMGGFTLSAVILAISGYFFVRFLNSLNLKRIPTLFLAFRNLYRGGFGTLSCLLALGLGALLINIIPQLRTILETEMTSPGQSKLPSLFLFDIQEDQIDQLKQTLEKNSIPLTSTSPMIRARVSRVNGESFVKGDINQDYFEREKAREMRFRNRGFNLTYRKTLDVSEEVIEGTPLDGVYDPDSEMKPKISVEWRFADRLGWKIGDIVEFDVQGIPVEAEIVNLRKIQWTSFQPNFFISFQEGVLEDAPKTFLATVPHLNFEEKNRAQQVIVQSFSNVSIVDVTRIVGRMIELVRSMSWILNFMALLCFVAGLAVLFSIASHQLASRKSEINLLKVLGANFNRISNIFLTEFFVMGIFSGLIGVILSVFLSGFISAVLFDSLWVWDWKTPLISVFALVAICTLMSKLTTFNVLRKKPSELFEA